MVILILLLLWAAVLIPVGWRKLSAHQEHLSLSSFHDALRGLGRSQHATSNAPQRPARELAPNVVRTRSHRMAARRRKTLRNLGLTILGTFVFGAIPPLRPLWYLSLVTTILTLGYLSLLAWVVRSELLASERRQKVIRFESTPAPRRALASQAQLVGPRELPTLQPAFRILEPARRVRSSLG